MRPLSAAGQQELHDLAERHGFGVDAVSSMLEAVRSGHGRMAQFRHPEFGGSGQWMRGGMTMVSDMLNATLKARVERLCDELSRLVANEPDGAAGELEPRGERVSIFASELAHQDRWWPRELGQADSAGAQNRVRYAYFASKRRLAIDTGGRITIYDTLDHQIGRVGQQQSERGSLTFSSQHGVIDVATLPVVDGGPPAPGSADVVTTIEKLAGLHRSGALSDAEFNAKKTELLNRL